MTEQEKTQQRTTLATIITTAAVTLALGVTVAALGGYLRPPEPPPESAQLETQPPKKPAPDVVLVPVTPHQPAEPQVYFAAERPGEAARYHGEAGDRDDDEDSEHDDD